MIEHRPRNLLKSQVLLDFVTECQFSKPMQITDSELNKMVEKWSLYVDGSFTSDASGVGIILVSPEGFIVKMAIKIVFKATNNEAEYEAMLVGLKLANAIQVYDVDIFSDSQLIVKQIKGQFKTFDEKMIILCCKSQGTITRV